MSRASVVSMLLLLQLASAPTPAATRYAEGSGLPNLAVTAVARDAGGYWWFGTEDGLVRFDGHQFVEVVLPGPGQLADTHVIALAADAGRVVAATRTRLFGVDPRTLAATAIRNAGEDLPGVLALAADGSGSMLAGTREGTLWRLPPPGEGGLSRLEPAGAGHPPAVHSLHVLGERVWIASSDGIWQLERSSGAITPLRVPLPALEDGRRHARAVLEVGDALWIGYWNDGAVRLEPGSGDVRWFHPAQPGAGALRATSVPVLATDGQRVYLGSNRGLYVHEPACDCIRGLNLPDWDEVDGNGIIVTALGVDADTVFAGLFGRGAVRFGAGDRAFGHVVPVDGRPDSLRAPMVRSLAVDDARRLWIGTHGGAVQWADADARPHGMTWRLGTLPWTPARTESRYAWSLEPAADALWVGTGAGLYRYADGALRAVDPNVESIRDTLRDAGGRRWVGTTSGLYVVAAGGLEAVTLDPGRPGSRQPLVWSLAEIDGEVWVGTDAGLYRLDGVRRLRAHHRIGTAADELPGTVVHAIHRAPDGAVWIGTSGGLVAAERGAEGVRFVRQRTLDGARVRAVLAVASDRNGLLWLGTQRGLVRYDPRGGDWIRYDRRDGLASDQFTANASASDGDRLYFGTVAGVVHFDPAGTPTAPPVLAPQIAQLRVGEDLLRLDAGPLRLARDHPPLRIEVTALEYARPERVRYAYRWSDDAAWTALGDAHSVIFSALPAGRRHLRLKAWIDDDGLPATEARALDVEVARAWHETPWGRAALLLALALLGWALAGWRLRAARAQRRALERRVADRTRDLAAATEALQEANRRLRDLATRDPLTGLANRRSLFDVAEAWRDAGHAMAVLLIDLDHFKRINDAHGHEAGDAVLRAFADLLRQHVRAGDLAVRYGGEEFLWLAQGAGAGELPVMAGRLVEAARRLHACLVGVTLPPVTVSIGAAVMRAGEAIDALVRRADAALYRAKSEGRDRWVMAD